MRIPRWLLILAAAGVCWDIGLYSFGWPIDPLRPLAVQVAWQAGGILLVLIGLRQSRRAPTRHARGERFAYRGRSVIAIEVCEVADDGFVSARYWIPVVGDATSAADAEVHSTIESIQSKGDER